MKYNKIVRPMVRNIGILERMPQGSSPTPSMTPTPSPSSTMTPTPSPSSTMTPTPSPSSTMTPTPSPSSTMTPTPSASPSQSGFQYLPTSNFVGWTVDKFGPEMGILGTPPADNWWRDWKLGVGNSGRCEYVNYSPGTGILGGEEGAVHEAIGTLMTTTMIPGFYRVRMDLIEFGVDQAVIILKNTQNLNPDQSVYIPPVVDPYIEFEAFGQYDYFMIKVISALPGQVLEINNIHLKTLADDIGVTPTPTPTPTPSPAVLREYINADVDFDSTDGWSFGSGDLGFEWFGFNGMANFVGQSESEELIASLNHPLNNLDMYTLVVNVDDISGYTVLDLKGNAALLGSFGLNPGLNIFQFNAYNGVTNIALSLNTDNTVDIERVSIKKYEEFIDGDINFDSSSGWDLGSEWDITDGTLNGNTQGENSFAQVFLTKRLERGVTYRLNFNVTSLNAGASYFSAAIELETGNTGATPQPTVMEGENNIIFSLDEFPENDWDAPYDFVIKFFSNSYGASISIDYISLIEI